MNHISLFNGIGGFQLAAAMMNWGNLASCEIDPFCNRVTKYHFPNCIQHEDIRTTDFTIYRGQCDILTGGFPCQPYSVAGQRKGKDDDRHLWPEMLRAIREIQPPWVVGENVSGLTNWNGGMVFNEVQADLEAEGYEVAPFLLPACAVNAPHRRDRIWIVAYAHRNDAGRYGYGKTGCPAGCHPTEQEERQRLRGFFERGSTKGPATHPGGTGRKERNVPGFAAKPGYCAGLDDAEQYASNSTNAGTESVRRFGQNPVHGFEPATNTTQPDKQRYGLRKECEGLPFGGCSSGKDWFSEFPTQSPVCAGNDGIPSGLDGITFSKWRNESIKAAGNAIVPQVAYQIFQAIYYYEQQVVIK